MEVFMVMVSEKGATLTGYVAFIGLFIGGLSSFFLLLYSEGWETIAKSFTSFFNFTIIFVFVFSIIMMVSAVILLFLWRKLPPAER